MVSIQLVAIYLQKVLQRVEYSSRESSNVIVILQVIFTFTSRLAASNSHVHACFLVYLLIFLASIYLACRCTRIHGEKERERERERETVGLARTA